MRDLQYMIDVMTAARNGKKIEWLSRENANDTWTTLHDPLLYSSWRWNSFDYRIASEPRKPREWRIPVLPEGEFVSVREVLPE